MNTEPHKPAPLIRWDSVLHCCKLFLLTVCVSLEGFCHTPLYYLALQVPYYKKGGSNRLCGTRGFRVNEDKWLFTCHHSVGCPVCLVSRYRLDSAGQCCAWHVRSHFYFCPGQVSHSPLRSEEGTFLGNNLTGKKHQFSHFHSQS